MNIKKQTNNSQLEKRKRKKETMYYDIVKYINIYIYIYIYLFIAQTIKFVAEKQRS